jgi:hypothetical protein
MTKDSQVINIEALGLAAISTVTKDGGAASNTITVAQYQHMPNGVNGHGIDGTGIPNFILVSYQMGRKYHVNRSY